MFYLGPSDEPEHSRLRSNPQVVFCVLAHDDPRMLDRLIHRLQPHDVVVHLDRRADLSNYTACMRHGGSSFVTWVNRRRFVYWGGHSVLAAMLECIQTAVNTHPGLDYVVFLSGHCYPIRPVDEFVTYLGSLKGRVHCNASPLSSFADPWHMQRVTRHHWFDLAGMMARWTTPLTGRVLRHAVKRMDIRTEAVDPSLTAVSGSQWMALPAACARDVLRLRTDRRFDVFKQAYAPDEMSIQTYIYSSSWRNRLHDDTGLSNPRTVAEHPNFHQLKANMDGFVDMDLVRAASGSGAFFIRKVHSGQEELLRLIDARLGYDPTP